MAESIEKLQKPNSRLKTLAGFLARTSLIEFLFVGVFILGRYLNNIDFSYPAEIVLPAVVFAVLGTAIFYLYRLVLKSVLASHIASLALLYSLYSFSYQLEIGGPIAKSLLPGGLETPFNVSIVLTLLLAVLYGLIGYVLAKYINGTKLLREIQLPKIIVFVIVFLFISQAYKAVDRLWQIRQQLSYQHSFAAPTQDKTKIKSKPDVYYLVFDRYGNNETLQNIYGYDNSFLTNFLNEQGLVTREQAYANYPFTMSSISSTMAMQYHTDLGKHFGGDPYQSAFPYRSILNNPPVAQILKQNGYQYNQVSSWWDFTRVGIKADSQPTKSFRFSFFGWHYYMSDLTRDIINKSVLSPWLKKGISFGKTPVVKYDLTRHPRENFEAQITALKSIASKNNNVPQFTFAHVLVPHDPYVFKADGSPTNYDEARNDNGVDETVKYTNQVTYLNTRIKELVSHIRQKSPDAAIIIQADEGPYPKEFRHALSVEHHYNPKDLQLPQQKQKFSILASYYMPGVDKETVAKNINASVNPFRFFLSNYLGYSLDNLPDCQLATGDKFIVYRFTPMTETLRGQDAAQKCNGY